MNATGRPAALALALAEPTALGSPAVGSSAEPYPSTTSKSTTAVVGSTISSRMYASRRDGSIIGCGRPWVNLSSPISMMVFSRLFPSLGNGELPAVGVLENALIRRKVDKL